MKTFFTFSFLFITILAFTQSNFSLLKQEEDLVEVGFKNSNTSFSYIEINGNQYIDFSQTHKNVMLQKGAPALPTFGESYILPNNGAVSFEVIYDGFHDVANVLVAPSKGNLKRNIDPSQVSFEFGQEYQQNGFFPASIINATEAFNLRSIRGQVLSLCPYQYNPVTKVLRIYDNLRIQIVIDKSKSGINEIIGQQLKPADIESYGQLFGNKPNIMDKYLTVKEEGGILYICPDSFADSLSALINWKIKRGSDVEVALTSTTGSTSVDIKAYVSSYYATHPSLKYLILIGDQAQINTHSYGISNGGEELYSDSYFGQLTGTDYYPELFVGRMPASTSAELGVMVRRNLEYEINPLSGDWMTRALGLASSQGAGIGDESQADWQHERAIRDQLLANGYTKVSEFYDGSRGQDDAPGDPNSAMITTVVNEGIGLFNYTGHGDQNTCVTGNFNSSEINSATNNGMYPFVISVACNNGTFVTGNCISETWLKATENNSPSGAIAACGSSILMSWAPPMETQDEMTNLNTKIESVGKIYTLGALFYNGQLSMLEKYPDKGVEVMQTWVMFGDPSIQFRSKVTENMTVSHDPCMPDVNVAEIQIFCEQDGALVALTQDNVLLGRAYSSAGMAIVSVNSIEVGSPVNVTVTKANYYPYQSSILTFADNCEPVSRFAIYPNPASDNIVSVELLTKSNDFDLRIVNVWGKDVSELVKVEKVFNKRKLDFSALGKGIFMLQLHDGTKLHLEKVVVE